MRLTLHGQHVASTMPLLAGIPAKNTAVTWTSMHLFRIEDGRVAEHGRARTTSTCCGNSRLGRRCHCRDPIGSAESAVPSRRGGHPSAARANGKITTMLQLYTRKDDESRILGAQTDGQGERDDPDHGDRSPGPESLILGLRAAAPADHLRWWAILGLNQ